MIRILTSRVALAVGGIAPHSNMAHESDEFKWLETPLGPTVA
jgi:hypothetical protein